MKQKYIHTLLSLYPKEFREKYADQILDVYDQGEEVNISDISLSIMKENMKRISAFMAALTLIPSAFFVGTNLYFYSITQTTMPSSVTTINDHIDSPVLILSSLLTAIIFASYSIFNGSIQMHNNILTVQFLGIHKNVLGISTNLVALSTLGVISLYLFAENIGF